VKADKKLDSLFWGGALLWAGLVFGGEAMGILPQVGDASAWSWVFLGAGIYALLLNLISFSSENYTNPSTWDWVWAGIFTIVGIGGFTALPISWPLIIILVGAAILGNALLARN